MKPFIPKRLAPIAFGLLLAGMMTFIVSGITNAIALGLTDPEFLSKWMGSWAVTWAVAFPVVLFVAPAVRKIVESLTIKG